MTKITNLPLAAIIAGTLIAMGTGPAFAQSNNVPEQLDEIIEILNAQQGAIDDLQNTVDDSQILLEPKTIFVTSTLHTGDLGGLAGADGICQGLADASLIVPEGEYIALLSTEDVTSSTRFGPTTGPFIRPDGVIVAAGYAELFGTIGSTTARDLINSVSIDEQGEENFSKTWTTTSNSGTPELDILGPLSACSAWTSEDFFARVGVSLARDDRWLNLENNDCDTPNAFYCVQR
jgi:hypothetical protein